MSALSNYTLPDLTALLTRLLASARRPEQTGQAGGRDPGR